MNFLLCETEAERKACRSGSDNNDLSFFHCSVG